MNQNTCHAYKQFLSSDRVRRLMNHGVFPQKLLWASTGTKDPAASDILYVKNLIMTFTINTIPENTLLAYADHGEIGPYLEGDLSSAENLISQIEKYSIDYHQLSAQLQHEGAEAFNNSWNNLIMSIETKRNNIKN